MNNYPILDNTIQELNKEYDTDFQYKIYNGRFWLWDANGVYDSEWYYNNIDYQNEVDPILTKLNEAVVNQFNNDELFIDYWNTRKMYISGLWFNDEETEEENTDEDHMLLRRDEIIEKYKDKIENLTEDDRHELARRGEIVNTANHNEVSADNRYIEETQRILEKIGRIAKATAEKLGWDEGLVFQDMIRDLQLLGNPALVEQLDPSNPIDQMTKQILEMQLQGLIGNEGDYEVFKSSTLNALMNMNEQQAANQLYQMFNRGRISGNTYQRVETRNPRRLTHDDIENDIVFECHDYALVETNLNKKIVYSLWLINREKGVGKNYSPTTKYFDTIEEGKKYAEEYYGKENVQDSKADDEAFVQKFGENNLTRYKRLTQKLTGNYKDITWVTAHIENEEDLNEMLNVTEFGEYVPFVENEYYAVFDIEDLQMCQKLAKGTTWCITSPSAYNTNARFGARYNFYINKITGEKYCVAMVGGMKDIVDQNDNELAKLPSNVPQVGEREIVSTVVKEDKPSSEALLQTALTNVKLLPVEALRVAYDDMFSEELDMLEDNEVKAWLLEKLPEVDTQVLKTYIEEHIDDFAILPSSNDDLEEIEYNPISEDEEEIELEELEENDEDTETDIITKEKIVESLKEELSKNKLIKIEKVEEDEENSIIVLNFSDEGYNLMSSRTSDNFYRKEMNIVVFDAEANQQEYFEIVVNRLGNEEDRTWIPKDSIDLMTINAMADYFSDKEIAKIIKEQNEVYE